MKRYPLKLKSVDKDILWGGTLLGEKYGKPAGKIAEAWELAVHPEGICRIANGEYAGMPLSDYLGSDKNFPIMIKLIDAREALSIQVHPVKTEMWYIVEAEPGARLVYGLKDAFDEAAFRQALREGRAEELLHYVDVHPGDVFFIPQGLVHAIGAGILIAEIQKNSNITYRVYDYGRLRDGKPRELHVEEAMRTVRDFTEEQIAALRYERAAGTPDESCLADCPSFRTDRYRVQGSLTLCGEDFVSIVCLEGSGTVDGEPMTIGDSYFIPKGYGPFPVEAQDCTILVTKP